MNAKSSHRTPTLRHHRATNQGYVVIEGRHLYLGRYDDPKTQHAYHRLLAEWTANGYRLSVDPEQITITELVSAYWSHARSYYVKLDGTPTGEADAVKAALRPLMQVYGETRAADFGPRALKAVRQRMVELGWSRSGVNAQISRVKRCFRWAVENEMVAPSIYHGLTAVAGLRQGRTEAYETKPVRPVPEAHVAAVAPYVSRQVRAMIALQLLTAARGGEIVMLRAIDLDISGAVWLARLQDHKTAYRGKERILYLGPKAQEIVKEFLISRPVDAYLFSPSEADLERRAIQHAARRTPLTYGNGPGMRRAKNAQRKPGDHYTTASYRRAIERGCRKANVPVWSPHRLRHNAATIIRREHGLEAAQLILGHARADVTQLYAEVNHLKAMEVAEKMG